MYTENHDAEAAGAYAVALAACGHIPEFFSRNVRLTNVEACDNWSLLIGCAAGVACSTVRADARWLSQQALETATVMALGGERPEGLPGPLSIDNLIMQARREATLILRDQQDAVQRVTAVLEQGWCSSTMVSDLIQKGC